MSPTCRNCAKALVTVFADLGMSPLANEYVAFEEATKKQSFYPLKAFVCDGCYLVQLEEIETPSVIFSDYAYLSSSSTSWLNHCETYVQTIIPRLGLDESTLVVEIASNDGYLLQYFAERNIPVLGVEPAANVAEIARRRGIPTTTEFFGTQVASALASDRKASLVVANNVLAHVPDLHDFVEGISVMLADDGVVTLEFPHLANLMSRLEFDTIYHEHFSYFSLKVVQDVLAEHDIRTIGVEELPTHGGSLRVHGARSGGPKDLVMPSVSRVLAFEAERGLNDLDTYRGFADQVKEAKRRLMQTLFDYKERGAGLVGYGAPAKAATLFNFCGIDHDILDFTVDANPLKQNRFIPGTRIPIFAPNALHETRPDFVWILPWNLKDEIISSMREVRDWGGQFLVWEMGMKEIS